MKILIIICLLVVAGQFQPFKGYIQDGINRINQQFDRRDQDAQEKADGIKGQYMKQAE